MPTVILTEQNVERAIKDNHIVFLQFWRATCNWCVLFAPVYAASAENHPEIVHGIVESDNAPRLNALNEITALPGIVAFREGLRVFKHQGFLAGDQFEEVVQQVRWLDMDQVRRDMAKLTQAAQQQAPTRQAPARQSAPTATNGAARSRTGAAVAGSNQYGWPGL